VEVLNNLYIFQKGMFVKRKSFDKYDLGLCKYQLDLSVVAVSQSNL